MTWLLMVSAGIVLCFGFVLLYGAPYLPTLTTQVQQALDMADLQPGQTLLELGCGDGKVLRAAAARGWRVVGYELNPLLALVAWLRTRRYGKRVQVVCGNFWTQQWPEADAIFVFLLDRFMPRLDTQIASLPRRPIRLISFAFQIPTKKPTAQGNGLFQYDYK